MVYVKVLGIFLLSIFFVVGVSAPRSHAAVIQETKVYLSSENLDDVADGSCQPGGSLELVSPSSMSVALGSFATKLALHDLKLVGQAGEPFYLTSPLPLARAVLVCEYGKLVQRFDASLARGGAFVYHGRLGPQGRTEIVVLMQSEAGPLFPVVLASQQSFDHPEFGLIIYWGLLGGLGAICFYNLFLWIGARKHLYRWNVIYISSIFVLNFIVGAGSMTLLVMTDFNPVLSRLMNALNNSSALSTASFLLVFLDRALELGKESRKLHALMRYLYWLGFVLTFLSFFCGLILNEVQVFNPVARVYSTVTLVFIVVAVAIHYRTTKNRYALLFALSYFPVIVGGVTFVQYLDGKITSNVLVQNSTLIGFFLESLGLSFVIGLRMAEIERGAFVAQTK